MRSSLWLLVLLVILSWSHLALAQRVSSVLAPIPSTISVAQADAYVYKRIGQTDLSLHVFQPEVRQDEPLPAIVFFFGGGWTSGATTQFVPHSHYLASRGMVAIVVDYRVQSRHGSNWFHSVRDAKSAIRWVREHAGELGIDPDRIVASGGSAGGHLAAATALVSGYNDESSSVSAIPSALVLYNPALDLTTFNRAADWMQGVTDISPLHLLRKGLPPTLILHGTADGTVPFSQAERFCAAASALADRCELEAYQGRTHGFFNYRVNDTADFVHSVLRMDQFLVSLGYLPWSASLPTFSSTSSSWLVSPYPNQVLDGDVPIQVRLPSEASSLVLRLDDELLYAERTVPEDLVLQPARLAAGDHTLRLTLVDAAGNEMHSATTFTVEHMRLTGIEPEDRLSGQVTFAVEFDAFSADEVAHTTIVLQPVIAQAASSEQEYVVFSGQGAPSTLVVDTLDVDDGAYNLVVEVATESGLQTQLLHRILVRNWETLEDDILPPLEAGFFGRVDRLRTVSRSGDWVHETDQPDQFFGDPHTMRSSGEGDASLVWRLPALYDFTFTVYTTDASLESVLAIDVSHDNSTWSPIDFTLEVVDRQAGRFKVRLHGLVPEEVDASHIRLTIKGDAQDATQVHIGHVALRGRAQ